MLVLFFRRQIKKPNTIRRIDYGNHCRVVPDGGGGGGKEEEYTRQQLIISSKITWLDERDYNLPDSV